MSKNKKDTKKDDKPGLMRTKKGRLILAPGTKIKASDRIYIVGKRGNWEVYKGE